MLFRSFNVSVPIYFCLSCLVAMLTARENSYQVENITVQEGLHHIQINSVAQDSLGFIWCGTPHGLERYDGYEFKLYQHDPADPSTLPSNDIKALFNDRNKQLWIASANGLSLYRQGYDAFTNFYFPDSIPYQVVAFRENEEGSIYLAINFVNSKYNLPNGSGSNPVTECGIYILDSRLGRFEALQVVNQTLMRYKHQAVLRDPDGDKIFESTVDFPPEYVQYMLSYKFLIRRGNEQPVWESLPNPGEGIYGNRKLKLDRNRIELPPYYFNSMSTNPNWDKPDPAGDNYHSGDPVTVTFRLDLSRLPDPLHEIKDVYLRGSIFPLSWEEEDWWITDFAFEGNRKLWVGTSHKGLFCFDLSNFAYKHYYHIPGRSDYLSDNRINAIHINIRGDLWIATESGLNHFDTQAGVLNRKYGDLHIRNNLDKDQISRVTEDAGGKLWMVSTYFHSRVICLDIANRRMQSYLGDSALNILSLIPDNTGIIWIGSQFHGIVKLNPHLRKFSRYTIVENNRDILLGHEIIALCEYDQKDVWLGGGLPDGLYRYDRMTGSYTSFQSAGRKDDFRNMLIWDIYLSKKGTLWICARGLYRYEPASGRFQKYFDTELRSIYEDRDGILWITATRDVLIRFDPETQTSQNFSVRNGGGVELLDLAGDGNGSIWVATLGRGLWKLDRTNKILIPVEEIQGYEISSLLWDNSGYLWCGTNGSGLIRYTPGEASILVVRETEGLLSNAITGLEQDDTGKLWISSKRGLTRYDPGKSEFKHYFKENGFYTNEFSFLGHNKGRDGLMIFGSAHGFIAFDPGKIIDNNHLPPVVLTEFRINDKPVQTKNRESFLTADHMDLSYDQNNFSVSFSALDYAFPSQNRYRFMLQNYDPHWRKPAGERRAYYTNLDPGTYIFRLEAANCDGLWNEDGRRLSIHIHPPWWKTIPAYIAYGILLAGIIFTVRRYELNRLDLRNESRRLKEIDQLKSRFFANISHEFRTPLSLILGPLQMLIRDHPDPDAAGQYTLMQRNALRLQNLINQLLDLSRLDAGKHKLNTGSYDVVKITRALIADFESYAHDRNITLSFCPCEEVMPACLDLDKYEKIITNLLSNAFKFSDEDTRITVTLNQVKKGDSGNFLALRISDQGIGIPPEQLSHVFDRFYQSENAGSRPFDGSGIGLALVRELVELHGGSIAVESEPGLGSTFSVMLPLNQDGTMNSGQDTRTTDTQRFTPALPGPGIPVSVIPQENVLPLLLIVEDNQDVQQYLISLLETDYNIMLASDGRHGLRQAVNEIPDLIISDIMMPEMDGLALCSHLKNDERTSHIPVILLTARATVEDKLTGLETGADDYLPKPFDMQELKIRVKNLIEQRKQLKEKFRSGTGLRLQTIATTSADEKFVQRLMKAISDKISDPELNIDYLSRGIGMSRMQLHRKIQGLFGQSPGVFLRDIRLKKAADLLKRKTGTISEIAYEVGFESHAAFTSAFRRRFGKTPSKFREKT